MAKYEELAGSMVHTEQSIGRVIAEKEAREEELLTKMSVIASQYRQEKEKNCKMVSEV